MGNQADNELFAALLQEALKPEKPGLWEGAVKPLLSSITALLVKAAFLWLGFFLVNLSLTFVPAISYWSAVGLVLVGNFVHTVIVGSRR